MLHYNKEYEVFSTPAFKSWYEGQEPVIRVIIDSRFDRAEKCGELGNIRYLGNKLFEFKWKIGIRVYFVIKDKKTIILLSGGNKNDQKRDIPKARKIQKAHEI